MKTAELPRKPAAKRAVIRTVSMPHDLLNDALRTQESLKYPTFSHYIQDLIRQSTLAHR